MKEYFIKLSNKVSLSLKVLTMLTDRKYNLVEFIDVEFVETINSTSNRSK